MVVANNTHGGDRRYRTATHVGCSVAGALVTVGFLLLVGVGTLFATLSVTGYLSTTLFVWLLLFWWVVWWLAAEVVVRRVNRVRARRTSG